MRTLSDRGLWRALSGRVVFGLALLGGAVAAQAADAACATATEQAAVEVATGNCSTFSSACEVPAGWAPVDRCFQDAYAADRDGIWSVTPGQTDSQGNPLNFSLLNLRISAPTNAGAVLFLHEGSWDGYIGQFDPVTASLRITTLNRQIYNVWSVNVGSDTAAWINGEVCRDGSTSAIAGEGGSTPSVTAKNRCLIPEGSQISLEKLL